MIIPASGLVGRYCADPDFDMQYEPVLEDCATLGMYILMFKAPCNFECQFCFFHTLLHNRLPSTLTLEKAIEEIQGDNITSVMLSGMECTQFPQLPEIARAIKAIGKEVNIHTNGTNPDMLKAMIDEGLIDYLAMDIKATPEKYELVTGVSVDIDAITKSIEQTKRLPLYKFRTTVCRELFEIGDIAKIAEWTGGGRHFELKGYWDAPKARNRENLSAYTHEEMLVLKAEAEKYYDRVFILEGRRGLGNA